MARSNTEEYQVMPEVIDVRRNPYLLDYEEQRRLRQVTGQTTGRRQVSGQGGYAQRPVRRQMGPCPQQPVREQFQRETGRSCMERDVEIHRRSSHTGREGGNGYRQENVGRRPYRPDQSMYTARPVRGGRPSQARGQEQLDPAMYTRRPAQARRPGQSPVQADRRQGNPYRDNARAALAARQRRKKKVLYQRLAVGIWTMCICLLAVVFFFWNGNASAAEPGNRTVTGDLPVQEPAKDPDTEVLIQGLPATEFAKHPEWTENFLTPNEYSRPGDPLTKVTNIFVHYTANPGTSAAQNRSYFEQQKDTHERSVSSHFIIGYEGEVLQCVPLDEIAYAVATRNEDSISIECCFTAADGSFTQETYDSLIALLAWLTDVYDLEPEDILRHYDCGGKKCPLYYTDHPDSWEKLKQDVAQARGL